MSYVIPTPIGSPTLGFIDYSIGDTLMNDESKIIGVCTGFRHADTCVDIDGKCWGGKYYFHKANIIDIKFEEL